MKPRPDSVRPRARLWPRNSCKAFVRPRSETMRPKPRPNAELRTSIKLRTVRIALIFNYKSAKANLITNGTKNRTK